MLGEKNLVIFRLISKFLYLLKEIVYCGIICKEIANIGKAIKYIATVIITTPSKLRTKPVLTICRMVIYSLPKTIALGGVATGIINANEVAIVAGIIKINGWTWNEMAMAANMGSIIDIVAVFDVISVKKVNNKQTVIISKMMLK